MLRPFAVAAYRRRNGALNEGARGLFIFDMSREKLLLTSEILDRYKQAVMKAPFFFQLSTLSFLVLAGGSAHAQGRSCPQGFSSVDGFCIDLTCRGTNESADAHITTWTGARNRCEELGGRLCGPAEILTTRGRGCTFDTEFIASSRPGVAVMRGFRVESDGRCNASYGGDFFATTFWSLTDMCSLQSVNVDAFNDSVDGFYCCY